jgi:hypothetical protein
MSKQTLLFEFEKRETELVAVWGQLTSQQRAIAMRLLAKLMVRCVLDEDSQQCAADGKAEADE